jgi:hypothetical protein
MINILNDLFFCGQTSCSITISLYNTNHKPLLKSTLHYSCTEPLDTNNFLITIEDILWFIHNKDDKYRLLIHINPASYAYQLNERYTKFPRFTPIDDSNFETICRIKCLQLLEALVYSLQTDNTEIEIYMKIAQMKDNKITFENLLICQLTL